MGLKYTRKILSVILTVIVAVSSFMGAVAFVMANTYGNQDFYEKYWCSDELAEECEKQLDESFSALSYKSGIPLDVFNAVKREADIKYFIDQAVKSLFSDYDSTLYNENRVDYFYSLCTMYLKANEYHYSEKDIKNVAREATKVFSDCVGIHNADMIRDFVSARQKTSNTYFSLSLIVSMLCIALIALLYKEKEKGFLYIGSAIIASGTGQLMMSVASVIFGIHSKFDVFPVAYEEVLIHLKNTFMLWNSVCGAAIIVLGALIFALAIRQVALKEYRSNSRYYKVVGKL